jgi:putative flippase GtrA
MSSNPQLGQADDPAQGPRAHDSSWRTRLPHLLALGLRFAFAGALNTLVGLAVILALDLGLGVTPALANLVGYAVGLTIGWSLQRRFVFRSDASGWATKAKYLTTIAGAFGLNQIVLAGMSYLTGDSDLERALSQLVAMATYTVVQFVVLRLWVFKATPAQPA